MPMPRKYIAEMIMDRISASRTYHPETYTDASPLEYFLKGKDRLWFIHPDTSAQIEYLLRMLAVKGEEKTLWYIKHVYLKNKGRFRRKRIHLCKPGERGTYPKMKKEDGRYCSARAERCRRSFLLHCISATVLLLM